MWVVRVYWLNGEEAWHAAFHSKATADAVADEQRRCRLIVQVTWEPEMKG